MNEQQYDINTRDIEFSYWLLYLVTWQPSARGTIGSLEIELNFLLYVHIEKYTTN